MEGIELVSSHGCFGGQQNRYKHSSSTLQCDMHFSVYLPPQAKSASPLPVVYWLSGLTCSDENFVNKAGAQRTAAELGIILVAPDTSPRGESVPDDPEEAYDMGKGAGFYLNATQAPWDRHYKMYDYIVEELPSILANNFNVKAKAALAGHSMGGHGALVIGLSNMQQFTSISAFAPIVNPINTDWGKKAFSGYLGQDQKAWLQYDACHLLQQQGPFMKIPIMIDQGLADNFLDSQRLTRPFEKIATDISYPCDIQYYEGYDHSYFFIASYIEAHLRFHHSHLMRQ